METIDLTPTPAEYQNIAERFAAQLLADVKRSRTKDDQKILSSLLEIAVYFGSLPDGAAQKAELLKRIESL